MIGLHRQAATCKYGWVENWEIQRVVAIAPTEGSGCDAAYLVKVSYGEEQADVIVEFAEPSSVASGGYAQEVLGPYLGDDEPPQRLVVERDGGVRVAGAPLGTERTPRRQIGPRAPQRGRRRSKR